MKTIKFWGCTLYFINKLVPFVETTDNSEKVQALSLVLYIKLKKNLLSTQEYSS